MTRFFLFLALLGATTCALAQEGAKTYDENATAESLGLERWDAPFFPLFPWDHLGTYEEKWQTLEEGIASMARCGCNLSAFVDDARGVEIAKANGLACICRVKFEPFDDRKLSEEEIQKRLDAQDELIKNAVEATKNDPAVFGYYLTDEPGAYYFRSLAGAVAAVKKYAPGKLAYINLYPGYASHLGADADSQLGTYSFREYLERYVQEVKPQFLSYDNYMIDYSEDFRTIGRGTVFLSDLFEVRDVALKYDLPFWFIGNCLCMREPSSPPTPARLAIQMYSALAAGAEGLTWFLFYPRGYTNSPIDANGRETLTWRYVRDINGQMKNLGTYLRDYRSTGCGISPFYSQEDQPKLPQFPGVPDEVLKNLSTSRSGFANNYKNAPRYLVGEFARKEGDAKAALVVNMDVASSIKISFELPEGYKTLKVVNANDGAETVVSEEDRQAGFWIIPGHGKLFVLEK